VTSQLKRQSAPRAACEIVTEAAPVFTAMHGARSKSRKERINGTAELIAASTCPGAIGDRARAFLTARFGVTIICCMFGASAMLKALPNGIVFFARVTVGA